MKDLAIREYQKLRAVLAPTEQGHDSPALPTVVEWRSPATREAASRHVTTEDLATVARTGNLNPLLEALAEGRLYEFETGARPRRRTLFQKIFGVADDVTTRTRDVLADMTDTIDEATAMLEAQGRFIAAGIQLSTAQKRATLEAATLDTKIAEQAAQNALHAAKAILENAKLATSIAEQSALRVQHEAAARRIEESDEIQETARRYRKQLTKGLRAVREEAHQQIRDLRRAARKRVRHADAEVQLLRAQLRRLETDRHVRATAHEAENRGRAEAQATIDELRAELAAARRGLTAHDDELARAKRVLELERIKGDTQKAQHDQRVAVAILEGRIQDARDPAGARRRKIEMHHHRELQRIEDDLHGFGNKDERITYARRECDASVQRTAEQYGENSDEHLAAISRAQEFMNELRDREEES